MRKYSVLNFILGTVFCALGVSLCTKSGFGLSMIGAPPYILHVWLSQYWPFFTQGTAEYVVQAVMLILTVIIVRRFKWRYLLCFATAVLCGLCIDGWLFLLGGNGLWGSLAARIVSLAAGLVITAFAIACFFRTDLPLQVYELLVAEVSDRYSKDTAKVKFIYDMCMLVLALALSLLLTGKLTGIGIGTVLAPLVNAPLISVFGRLIDKIEKTEQLSAEEAQEELPPEETL